MDQVTVPSRVPGSAGAVLRALGGPLRILTPVVILVVLAQRVGAGPFEAAFAATSPALLAAAVAVTAVTTACNAWRWRIVAAGLDLHIPLSTAVAACYRSQLLNAALPLGVLGDLQRGVGHGLSQGHAGRGLRAVVCERTAGQGVQLVVTAAVLLLLPSPVHPLVGLAAGGAGLVLGAAVLVGGRGARGRRRGGTAHGATGLTGGGLVRVVAASFAATWGHVVVFLLAVRAASVDLPAVEMVPLALVVLLAAAVPVNLAGWGPREGVAAWVFSSVGLTAAQGVEVSVVYGLMALVATLPGLAVVAGGRVRRSTSGNRLGRVHG